MSKYGIDVEDLIERATYKAIKIYDKEKKIEQKKKVLHNTKLLLKHYNDLRDHADRAIDSINQIDLSEISIEDMDKDDLYILSIKKSKIKTMLMIENINEAMERLENKQKRLHTIYKYEALTKHYIEGMTLEELQEELRCGKNTPGRWINQMTNELSVMLFGIEGIRDLV